MGIPQVIYLMFVAVEITWQVAHQGQPEGNYDGVATAIAHAFILGLLWWGGFFGK